MDRSRAGELFQFVVVVNYDVAPEEQRVADVWTTFLDQSNLLKFFMVPTRSFIDANCNTTIFYGLVAGLTRDQSCC